MHRKTVSTSLGSLYAVQSFVSKTAMLAHIITALSFDKGLSIVGLTLHNSGLPVLSYGKDDCNDLTNQNITCSNQEYGPLLFILVKDTSSVEFKIEILQ